MKIFLIKRTDDIGYDEYDSFVIRAESEEKARQLANDKGASFEPENCWLDPQVSVCVEVTADGPEEVLIGSYNAG